MSGPYLALVLGVLAAWVTLWCALESAVRLAALGLVTSLVARDSLTKYINLAYTWWEWLLELTMSIFFTVVLLPFGLADGSDIPREPLSYFPNHPQPLFIYGLAGMALLTGMLALLLLFMPKDSENERELRIIEGVHFSAMLVILIGCVVAVFLALPAFWPTATYDLIQDGKEHIAQFAQRHNRHSVFV